MFFAYVVLVSFFAFLFLRAFHASHFLSPLRAVLFCSEFVAGRLGLHLFSLTFRRQRGRMLTFGLRCYVSAGMYTSQVWGTGSVQALVSPLLASLSGNLSCMHAAFWLAQPFLFLSSYESGVGHRLRAGRQGNF